MTNRMPWSPDLHPAITATGWVGLRNRAFAARPQSVSSPRKQKNRRSKSRSGSLSHVSQNLGVLPKQVPAPARLIQPPKTHGSPAIRTNAKRKCKSVGVCVAHNLLVAEGLSHSCIHLACLRGFHGYSSHGNGRSRPFLMCHGLLIGTLDK